MSEIPREVINRITQELVDKGLLIEAGWVGLRMVSLPPNAPQVQVDSMRMAFFAGAQHLFSSLLSFMDEDREPTDRDMVRMAMVQSELDEYLKQFKKQHGLPPDKEEKRQS
jgi:hypothetical protein